MWTQLVVTLPLVEIGRRNLNNTRFVLDNRKAEEREVNLIKSEVKLPAEPRAAIVKRHPYRDIVQSIQGPIRRTSIKMSWMASGRRDNVVDTMGFVANGYICNL